MDSFLSILLSFLVLVSNVESFTIQCYDQTDCDGLTFTRADSLYAYGYKSLYFAPSPQQSHTLIRTCDGAVSCAESSYISDDNHLSCNGFGACANIELIEVNTAIYGFGANSIHSTFTLLSAASTLSCRGYQACAHSETNVDDGTATPAVYGGGTLSLYNATINVLQGELTLILSGYYAGYHAVLHCRDGTTCNIDCFHNSCGGFELICDSGATCIITKSSNATLLPNTIISESEILFLDSSTTTEYNEYKCSEQNTDKTLDTAYEHQNGSPLNYSTDEGLICCRAYSSCRNTAIYYNDAVAPSVVCSGADACRETTIQSNSDIIIECSASQSCWDATMTGSIYMNNETVYCYGYRSCAYATITSISTIICSGYRSCRASNITSNGDMSHMTVYFYGEQAGYSLTSVTCSSGDKCNIICDGYKSCKEVAFTCEGDCFIQCNEDSLCPIGWTASPTSNPTNDPSSDPTIDPTTAPTSDPTSDPIINPTFDPTIEPTQATNEPTNYPTIDPTIVLTNDPSFDPTFNPTVDPTADPSVEPTRDPTIFPTFYPSNISSFLPSSNPSAFPSYYSIISSTEYGTNPNKNKDIQAGQLHISSSLWSVLEVLSIFDATILIGCLVYIYLNVLKRTKLPGNSSWSHALRQFEKMNYIVVVLELSDLVTDYIFAADLIMDGSATANLGWISLMLSVFGLIMFYTKYILIRKLWGFQVAKYRKQLKECSDITQRTTIMIEIRHRRMDIGVFSLLNGCIEDIPQSCIVLIVLTNIGFGYVSILSLSFSVASFLMKLMIVLMSKFGCRDVDDQFDEQETEDMVMGAIRSNTRVDAALDKGKYVSISQKEQEK